jgi:hypothetical protein
VTRLPCEQTGMGLDRVTLDMLGTASRAVLRQDSCTLVLDGKNKVSGTGDDHNMVMMMVKIFRGWRRVRVIVTEGLLSVIGVGARPSVSHHTDVQVCSKSRSVQKASRSIMCFFSLRQEAIDARIQQIHVDVNIRARRTSSHRLQVVLLLC